MSQYRCMIRIAIGVALACFACRSGSAQIQAYLDYDPVLGNLSVDTVSETNGIVTFELRADDQFLTTTYPSVLDGLFDVYAPSKIFKLDIDGFYNIDFGPVLTPELPIGELAGNLCIAGSVVQGGPLENVHLRSGEVTFPISQACNFDPNFNPNANEGNPDFPPRPNPNPNPNPNPDPVPDPGPIVAGQAGLPFFLDYAPATGGLVVNSPDAALTTLELDSSSGLFTGPKPLALNGLFDVLRPEKLFHLKPSGFNSLDVGDIVTPGTAAETLASDLCYNGSVISGGRPGDLFVRSSEQLHPVTCGAGVGNPNQNPNPNPNPNPIRPPYGQPFFLDFDSETGALAVDSPETSITVLELTSNSGLFAGTKPNALDSIFDVFIRDKVFRLDPNGFQSLDLENAVAAGTSAEALAADICYDGAIAPGGLLGDLYVRSGDAVHAVSCGAPPESVDLAAAMDPNADIGVFVDPEGGNLVVHVPGDPDGAFKPLTRFEINADSDVFLPGNKLAGALEGESDVLTASHLLKIDENGFGTVDFGPILRDGISLGDLESVFSVSATFDGGEAASSVQFVNLAVVPEPTNGLLLMFSALLLWARRR